MVYIYLLVSDMCKTALYYLPAALFLQNLWYAEDIAMKESTQYNSHGGHLVGSASRSNNLMTL